MYRNKAKKQTINIKSCIALTIPLFIITLFYIQITYLRQKVFLTNFTNDKSQDILPPSYEYDPNKIVTYSEPKRLIFHRPELDQFYHKTTDKGIKINWENLVFIMLTHDDPKASSLIQAQFETWVKRAGKGLDIVIVTDIDDVRSDDEIVPQMNKMKWINVDIYRSDTPKEGRKGRSKVLDGFFYVQKKYQNNVQKMYVMKIDPDNYLLPYTLMKFLNELHQRTYPQPVDFGKSNCNNDFVCYSQGGLYGWDRGGFERTFNYMTYHKDTIYDEIYYNKWNPGRNILQNEDVFTSFVFRKATGYPSIFNRGIGANLTEIIHYKQMPKDLVSIHPIKTIDDFGKLDEIFYVGDTNTQKSGGGALATLLKNSHLLDMSKLFWDAQKMEFRQT